MAIFWSFFWILFAILMVLGFLGVVQFLFLITGILGAPYVPSSDKALERMIQLSGIKSGEKMADLGAGDGKIIIAFAKKGAEAHGFESNPILVLWTKRRIKKMGLQNNAFMHFGNFWKRNFGDFDVVTVYGLTHIMGMLERKLQKELKTGSRVVSNSFEFPNWKPERSEDYVFLYKKS